MTQIRISISEEQTPTQILITGAVIGSKHSLAVIAKRSGYSKCTIRTWIRGKCEPRPQSFDDVMQCIEELDQIKPEFNWGNNIDKLLRYRAKGFSMKYIAKKFGMTTKCANAGYHRYLKSK
jgi:transcriptional regulator with XRE-family HTH domain